MKSIITFRSFGNFVEIRKVYFITSIKKMLCFMQKENDHDAQKRIQNRLDTDDANQSKTIDLQFFCLIHS